MLSGTPCPFGVRFMKEGIWSDVAFCQENGNVRIVNMNSLCGGECSCDAWKNGKCTLIHED